MRFKYLLKRSFINLKKYGLFPTCKKILDILFKNNKIDLDVLIKNSPDNLDDIFIKFGTDKGSLDSKKTYDSLYKNNKSSQFKNYLSWIERPDLKNYEYQMGLNSSPIYENVFKKRRLEKLKILELGVANGHSIASWHHYFPNSEIYGIDNKKSFKFFYKSSRVKYFQLDIFNEKKIKEFIKNYGKFDYIIDDSLNTEAAMLHNIKNFYPSLESGGAYFLEDYGFYDHVQKAMQEVKLYNTKNGMRYFLNSRTMRSILEMLKNKTIFDDEILNKKILEDIFSTLENIEFGNYKHPYAAIAIMYKKNFNN
jgi:hypothetical protein|tara:strand:+ start:1075 stop:2001 length:927 start_codon:yes stop_codon:yes gene_type:complete